MSPNSQDKKYGLLALDTSAWMMFARTLNTVIVDHLMKWNDPAVGFEHGI